MRRSHSVLGLLLLVQVVLILVVRSPFSNASGQSAARALLPALAGITAVRVELSGGAEDKVTLLKKDGRWTVDEAGGFPADQKKVDELIDELRGLEVRRPVVSSSRYHSTFKVTEGEPEARVRVWADASADPAADLILGTSSNYRATHVRRAGEDPVYEARGLASHQVRADKSDWIEKQLVDVPQGQLVGLALTNAAGSFELARRDGAWVVSAPESMSERALDQDKVDGLIRAASPLRMSDAAGPLDETAQGLAKPSARLTLRWSPVATGEDSEATPEELTVLVGSPVPDKDNQRYITRPGLGFTGTIWDSSVSKLLEQKLAELTAGS